MFGCLEMTMLPVVSAHEVNGLSTSASDRRLTWTFGSGAKVTSASPLPAVPSAADARHAVRMEAPADDPSDEQFRTHYRSIAWFWIGVCIAVVIVVVVFAVIAADWGLFDIVDGSDAGVVVT